MRFPHGDTVQVWRPGPADRYGDRTWSHSHDLHGVGVGYPSTSENVNGGGQMTAENREQIVVDAVLYAHTGDDVTASDRVHMDDGTVYSVIGKPLPRKSPFSGWLPGVVIRLKAVEG